MEVVEINVTQEDIDRGQNTTKGNRTENCPLQLAVKRVFPDKDTLVLLTIIAVKEDSKTVSITMPHTMQNFRHKADTEYENYWGRLDYNCEKLPPLTSKLQPQKFNLTIY